MCGILGVVGGLVDLDVFDTALERLRHRGPDDSGVYSDELVALGHRRLSIIDLSSAAKQPMCSSKGDAVLVFNGEIYNYIELRHELQTLGYQFHTDSDTEVLLSAFREWGAGCLNKLNGMWAFAVWSPHTKELFFARDRFGVKPFYYTWNGSQFAFASEPKALIALFPEYRRVDEVALYEFLADGNLYGRGRSFYEHIKVLSPAHFGLLDTTKMNLSIQRYWDYPVHVASVKDSTTAADEFTELFDSAVRLRLRSDVEVGLTLSGGLDSTAILASTNKDRNSLLKCYTSTYQGNYEGEIEWAIRAAGKNNNPLIQVKAGREHWLEKLHQIAWYMDGPGYSPAVYPLWQLMAEARSQNVLVMLEGQGADELFGGYVQHSVLQALELLMEATSALSWSKARSAEEAIRGLLKTYPVQKVLLRFVREAFPALLSIYRKKRGSLGLLRREFAEAAINKGAIVQAAIPKKFSNKVDNRLIYDHSYAILPGLLHYGDAISMAHGIESRHPFLDYRLVEWAFKLPATTKLAHGQTKWLVRDYLRNWGWAEFGNRWDKKGYPTPIGAWMREQDGAILQDLLMGEDACINEYCDPEQVRQLIKVFLKGGTGAENHLYRLISTELWLQACM